MKLLTLTASLALLACFACGNLGDPEKSPPKEPSRSEAIERGAAAAAEPAVQSADRPVDAGRTTQAGRITGDGEAEAALSLSFGEDGRMEGTASIGGADRSIAGVVDGDVVRGWIFGPGGEGQLRGTLLGRKGADGTFAGDFAVSDSGAARVIRGTWSTAK